MKNYVFEFHVAGDFDKEYPSREIAEKSLSDMDVAEILEMFNGMSMGIKCVGTRNEDGSITYFE